MLGIYTHYRARNELFKKFQLTSLCLTGLMIFLFGSQMMVASLSGTFSFGTTLMVGFEGLDIKPPLLLLVLRGFGPRDYHFHLSIAHSLSGVHTS